MPSFVTAQVLSFCRRPAWMVVLGLAVVPAAGAASEPFAHEAMALWLDATRSAAHQGYEISHLILPQLGEPAWATLAQRPGSGGTSATQRIGMTRWLTPEAPYSLGLSLGVSQGLTADAASHVPSPVTPARVDLGLRWRSRLDSGRHLQVTAWAEAPRDAVDLIWQREHLVYGTRLEVQWASSRTRGLVPEFGAIGVQLQRAPPLVLRAPRRGPLLYYRATS